MAFGRSRGESAKNSRNERSQSRSKVPSRTSHPPILFAPPTRLRLCDIHWTAHKTALCIGARRFPPGTSSPPPPKKMPHPDRAGAEDEEEEAACDRMGPHPDAADAVGGAGEEGGRNAAVAAGEDVALEPLPEPLPAPKKADPETETAEVEGPGADGGGEADEGGAAVPPPPKKKRKRVRRKKAPEERARDRRMTLHRVAEAFVAYQTDLSDPESVAAHPSGMILATRIITVYKDDDEDEREVMEEFRDAVGGEKFVKKTERAFAWIEDAEDVATWRTVLKLLEKKGYDATNARFVPFSGRGKWIETYPQAAPCLVADERGGIVGTVDDPSDEGAARTIKRPRAKKARGGAGSERTGKKKPSKFTPNGILPEAERDELHREIHSYLSWLKEELEGTAAEEGMLNKQGNRRGKVRSNVKTDALAGALAKMEEAFPKLELGKEEEAEKGGADEGGEEQDAAKPRAETANADPDSDAKKSDPPPRLPLLERALSSHLARRAAERAARTVTPPSWSDRTFEDLFQRLMEYRDEEGHVNPPLKHRELGKWVSYLRANKKRLRDKGLEWEPEEKGGEHGFKGRPLPAHLARSRVEALDAVGFRWQAGRTDAPPQSWDERLEELRAFRAAHGRDPQNREGAIGNWLKVQKKLYVGGDEKFMANKFHKVSVMRCRRGEKRRARKGR
ncbi:hypothetical protein ACHAWF_011763 [Thalassiosira exigua]